MATKQMTPSTLATNPVTVNGRTYKCNVGAVINVPDFDALEMEANGWVGVLTGTTAQRPTAPGKGDSYYDTTVGAIVHFDGKNWRNLTTGAAV